MALAVAGLAADEAVTIQGAEIMAESFPGFSTTLEALGASILVEGEADARTVARRKRPER